MRWIMLVASEVVDNASFFLEMRPNRSLTPAGRRLWFGLIASTTALLASAAVFDNKEQLCRVMWAFACADVLSSPAVQDFLIEKLNYLGDD